MASETSASVGSMTEETAAIAEAPQIAVPMLTSSRSLTSSPRNRPISGASPSATAIVPSVTGSVPKPVRQIAESDIAKPETTIAACSTVFAA